MKVNDLMKSQKTACIFLIKVTEWV